MIGAAERLYAPVIAVLVYVHDRTGNRWATTQGTDVFCYRRQYVFNLSSLASLPLPPRLHPTKILQTLLTVVTLMASFESTDIAAGDTNQVVQWAANDTDDYIVLSTQLLNQTPFVETNNIAQDATAYYSFKKV